MFKVFLSLDSSEEVRKDEKWFFHLLSILFTQAADNLRKKMFQSLSEWKIQMLDVMSSKHSVVSLPDENILGITNRTVEIEQQKIINDVKMFSNDCNFV